MFEITAIISALIVLTTFGTVSIKFFQFTGLEAESPIVVLKEMFPPIQTEDRE